MIPKFLLFDFDGTLADSFAATLAIANRLGLKYGYPPISEADAASLRSQGIRRILQNSRLPLRRLPSWMREFREEMEKEMPRLRPPHALHENLLALRHADIPLAIVTSNSKENVQLFLENNGWTNVFTHLETGSNLFGKSRRIKRLLNRSSFPASQAYYIGDEERDVEAAKRAGVLSVAVTWGFNDREILTRSQPDHLLDHPRQLIQLVGLLPHQGNAEKH